MTLCVALVDLGVQVNNMYVTTSTISHEGYYTTYTTSLLTEPTDRPSTPVEVYRYKTKEDDYLPALLASL